MQGKFILSVRSALLLVTVSALLPALLIIIVSGVEHGRTLEQSVRAEAHRQVESITQVHLETVQAVQRILETLGALEPFQEDNRPVQTLVLSALLRDNSEIVNFAVTDNQGIVTTSPLLPTGTDLSDRAHVRNALGKGRFSAGEFVLARAGGIPSFPFAHPLRDATGAITGVLAVVYNLGDYRELFDRMTLPESNIVGITDNRGIRIFYRPENLANPVGVPIADENWRRMRDGEETGSFISDGSDGVLRYYAYRRVLLRASADPHIYVLVGVPEDVAAGAARRIIVRNVALMAAVLLLALAAAILLGDLVFSRGFRVLVSTAHAISEGRLEARTNLPRGRSEIAVLASAVDRMAVRLQKREEEKETERAILDRSLREKEVLLREIHHRVKNNMQMILSIVSLQQENSGDMVHFRSALESRIRAMAAVHEMLYESPDVAAVDVSSLLQRLAEMTVWIAPHTGPAPRILMKVEGGTSIFLSIEYAVPLALITSEVMTNSCKYGRNAEGAVEISITLDRVGDTFHLSVGDSGVGFPRKAGPPGPAEETGLGLQLVSALVSQLKGSLEFLNGYGHCSGAVVRVTFPVAEDRLH